MELGERGGKVHVSHSPPSPSETRRAVSGANLLPVHKGGKSVSEGKRRDTRKDEDTREGSHISHFPSIPILKGASLFLLLRTQPPKNNLRHSGDLS